MAPIKTDYSNTSTPDISGPRDLLVDAEIPLGEYLFLRICQANPKLKTLFGIPGDFNLALMEHMYADSVEKQNGVKFVGLCNELNGAYTVDGYSRAIGGLGVLITTFGVGELSALNGVSLSYSEFNPVLHIVGTSSQTYRDYAQKGEGIPHNYHHLIQNIDSRKHPNHDIYKTMSKAVSVIQESLETTDDTVLDQIDKVLTTIIQESRPGYLFIPVDLPDRKVSSRRLFEQPLDFSAAGINTTSGKQMLNKVTREILAHLCSAHQPSFVSDLLMSRYQLHPLVDTLIGKLPENHIKLFNSNMARGMDETRLDYVGVYQGWGSSSPETRLAMEKNTDLLIRFGYFNAETNCANYTDDLLEIQTLIDIHPDYVRINDTFHEIKDFSTGERLFSMSDLMNELINQVDAAKLQPSQKFGYQYTPAEKHHSDDPLALKFVTQKKLYDYLNTKLQPNDILIVETTAFLFGLPDIRLPSGAKIIAGQYYGSIGYALPSLVGVTFAINDLGPECRHKRILLIEGDGSAQMTIQELTAYIKYHHMLPIKPTIFLMNNDGYTIERWIKGPTRPYNDIAPCWNWTQLLETFGDRQKKWHTTATIKNVAEFEEYYSSHEKNPSKLELVELIMDKLDVPHKLNVLVGRGEH